MAPTIPSGIKVKRRADEGEYPFTEIFSGFEKIQGVRRVFGGKGGSNDADETKVKEILSKQKVEIFSGEGYMGVNDEDGRIYVSKEYLEKGDPESIYLDVVHELVHVKQFMDGKKLFDRTYSYVERPTEVEAYRITVEEARRIGMTEEYIFNYLKVDWITRKEHIRLAEAMGVKPVSN
jgi:hypothetical protein